MRCRPDLGQHLAVDPDEPRAKEVGVRRIGAQYVILVSERHQPDRDASITTRSEGRR
jgi:hypothetical protein